MTCICGCNESVDTEVGVRAPFVVERTFVEPTVYSHRCLACNTRWCSPRFSDKQIHLLYNNYRSTEYDAMRERHEPDYAERKHQHLGYRENTRTAEYMLQPYLKQPRILDVGGYDGQNTPLRHIAETHHVYEIENVPTVENAITIDMPQPPYDLVVLSHVLEHVNAPADFLADWAQHSSKIVYVEVPHADLRTAPTYWHEHITMFTPSGICMLLKSVGLRLTDMKIKNNAILTVSRVRPKR